MPTVDEWKYLKRRYQNLKANANAVLAELDNCKILISTANTNFSKELLQMMIIRLMVESLIQ